MTDHHPLARSIPRTGHNTTGGMRTAIVLLLFAVLLTPSLAFSQPAAPACPPSPAIPSAEEIQAMFTTAKDRGFLWKYDKDGHAGYLFGSIHLGRRDWIVPGPKTMAALQSSGVIALELDVLDPQIHAQLSDPAKAGIARVTLPPTLQLRMNAIARRVCASDGALAALHPLMQLITLTMLQARFAMRRVLDVPPEAFHPVPAVNSAIVRMQPLPQALVSAALQPRFEQVVAAAFPVVTVDADTATQVMRGVRIPVEPGAQIQGGGVVGLFTSDGRVLSIAEPRDGLYAHLVVFS